MASPPENTPKSMYSSRQLELKKKVSVLLASVSQDGVQSCQSSANEEGTSERREP